MEHRESGWLAVDLGDHRLGRGRIAEQPLAQQFGSADDLIGCLLVLGQRDDQ